MLDYPEPTIYAAPFFLATLVAEVVLLARWKTAGRDVVGYEKKDAWASLGMAVGSLVTVTVINAGVFLLAMWLYRHRLVDVGSGVLGWVVAVIGWDFAYYWHHRLEHESRIFWASHVNHHSSRFFNLSTALRQPWTPVTMLVFFPPLALVGVPPWMIMVSGGLNLIYQFWIHTEIIGKLPRWFEAVFNTPSHHRVHHGSNVEYLDKNYAGVLIVWDRCFGTFVEERARVVYGLTKNITSFNPFIIAFHEYAAILRDLRAAPTWRARAGVAWHGPGWVRSDDVRPSDGAD
jgi:sterol desaturase/sphingolipid hydroxylase (fatty acid hydroxylase superfamily)